MEGPVASDNNRPIGSDRSDILIAGGGLSGSLIAWRLSQVRPDLTVTVIEQGQSLGGNHTWSFHSTDVPVSAHEWISPLIKHRWSDQEIRFPAYRRPLGTGYGSIPSSVLDEVVRPDLDEQRLVQGTISELNSNSVTLADGRRFHAHAVIDARGQRGFEHLILGYQKFVGCVFR
ncbi:MAG: NAD(P)-binding protein, partial [Parvularculaceae bacterium]|nr:NAD(P)-binding protein [Parvularculaceae bacterium]